MAETKAKRTRRSFTEDYKTGASRLVLDEGKTVAAVARDLGLTESSLGIDHLYGVTSDDTPSLLPDGAVARTGYYLHPRCVGRLGRVEPAAWPRCFG